MSGKYIGDVCMATGTYKDKYGNTKKRWLTIGAAFQSDKCTYIKLDALPLPSENGCFLAIFKHENQKVNNYNHNQNNVDETNDVPSFKADFVPSIDDVCPF